MFIYFLRHASAGQSLTNPKKDEKRGLDKDGIEQCGYVGRALAALGVQVEVIVSSPLKRSTQTASLVGNEMGHEGKLVPENKSDPFLSPRARGPRSLCRAESVSRRQFHCAPKRRFAPPIGSCPSWPPAPDEATLMP